MLFYILLNITCWSFVPMVLPAKYGNVIKNYLLSLKILNLKHCGLQNMLLGHYIDIYILTESLHYK